MEKVVLINGTQKEKKKKDPTSDTLRFQETKIFIGTSSPNKKATVLVPRSN